MPYSYICRGCGACFSAPQKRRDYCSLTCYVATRPKPVLKEQPRGRPRRDPVAFFQQQTIKGDGCWPWAGRLDEDGYGEFHIGQARTKAHRFALEQAMNGPIPDGFCALHTCDNRRCVRNDDVGTYEVAGKTFPRWGHLWLGTDRDNTDDRNAKERNPSGTEHWRHSKRT